MKPIRVYVKDKIVKSNDYYAWSYKGNNCQGGDGCSKCCFYRQCSVYNFPTLKSNILAYLPTNPNTDFILLTPETYPEVFI